MADDQKSFTTALVVLPPESAWPQIDAIRSSHDKAFGRWMPHVNLLFPFVPEAQFADAALKLERAVAEHGAFTVELARFRSFPHGNVHLDPQITPSTALQSLFGKIVAQFPLLNVRPEFHPHLTVGQWSKGQLASSCTQLAANWSPIVFECHEIALIARSGSEPFRIVRRVSIRRAAAPAPPIAAAAAAVPVPPPPPPPPVPMVAAAVQRAQQASSSSVAWSEMRGSIDPDATLFAEAVAEATGSTSAATRKTVQAPASLQAAYREAFVRVRDWSVGVHVDQLPKTRARLVQALRPFLRAVVPVSVERMLATLIADGYVTETQTIVVPGKKAIKKAASPGVTLPKQLAADAKKQPTMPHAQLADSNASEADAFELARQRCVALLTASGTKISSRNSLLASLRLVCRVSKPLDASILVDALVESQLIAFVDPPPPNYARALTRSQRHGDEEKRIEWMKIE